MKHILLILGAIGLLSTATAQKKIPSSHNTCKESWNRRTEIITPQVKGYNCYKADLHVHTSYSDGCVNPSGRVIEAWYEGMDILAITDHYESHGGVKKFFKVVAPYNKNKKPTRYVVPGSTKMPKDGIDPGLKVDFNAIHKEAAASNIRHNYGMLIIKGCEMARNKEKLGHYNAIFVKDLNSVYAFELKEAFKKVKEQGGLIFHNHPGDVSRYEKEWHEDVHKSGLIDGIEVANGFRYYPQMVNRCIERKYFMVGNTDAHGFTAHRYTVNGCFRTHTIIFAKECTEEMVKDALLNRRTIVYSGGDLIGEEEWLSEFLNASIECQFVKESSKGDSRTYTFTNISSYPYRLRVGGTVHVLEPFKTLTIPFGKDKKTGKLLKPVCRVENMWCADYQHPTIEIKIDKKQ